MSALIDSERSTCLNRDEIRNLYRLNPLAKGNASGVFRTTRVLNIAPIGGMVICVPDGGHILKNGSPSFSYRRKVAKPMGIAITSLVSLGK
jgi:hypothetical protein